MTPDIRQSIAYWKPIISALDPWRNLTVERVDDLYVERPDTPHLGLSTDLWTAEDPARLKVLLCGARGSGKTTELARLARVVGHDFLVVETDLNSGLPEQTGTLAIVMLLGAAALKALDAVQQVGAGTALVPVEQHTQTLDAALRPFGEHLPTIGRIVSKVGSVVRFVFAGAGDEIKSWGQGLTEAGEASRALRAELARGPLGGRIGKDQAQDAQKVVDAVNAILRDLARAADRPVLLLADGLDRRPTFADVQHALANAELLRDLQAALILTGPIQLRHDPRFQGLPGDFRLQPLYNIPVVDPAGKSDPAGIDLLLRLYEKRRADAGLAPDLIARPLLEQAARMSAGIVRGFLDALQGAAKHAVRTGRRRLEEEDIDAAERDQRLLMQGYLNEGRIRILRRILDERILPTDREADTLLFGNYVACYPNGDVWFRPHEMLVDYVTRQTGRG